MPEKMTVTALEDSPGVGTKREEFQVYKIEISRGGQDKLFEFTLPEIRKEMDRQDMIATWRTAELQLRIFEENQAETATLTAALGATQQRLFDLAYARTMIETAPAG